MAIGIMTGGTAEAPEITKSFEGAVLETFERNGYDDSDFFALVWDDSKQSIEQIEYATTRGWTYKNYAIVDATDEVKAKARAYAEVQTFASLRSLSAKKAKTPALGKTVTVLKGKHSGKIGPVFWAGNVAKFRGPGSEFRIGIDAPSGKFFTLGRNAEVIDPIEYIESDAELAAQAKRFAQGLGGRGGSWRSLNAQLFSDALYGVNIPAGAGPF